MEKNISIISLLLLVFPILSFCKERCAFEVMVRQGSYNDFMQENKKRVKKKKWNLDKRYYNLNQKFRSESNANSFYEVNLVESGSGLDKECTFHVTNHVDGFLVVKEKFVCGSDHHYPYGRQRWLSAIKGQKTRMKIKCTVTSKPIAQNQKIFDGGSDIRYTRASKNINEFGENPKAPEFWTCKTKDTRVAKVTSTELGIDKSVKSVIGSVELIHKSLSDKIRFRVGVLGSEDHRLFNGNNADLEVSTTFSVGRKKYYWFRRSTLCNPRHPDVHSVDYYLKVKGKDVKINVLNSCSMKCLN